MTLVNQTIPSLVNGVSQQPAVQRLASQCELQENCVATVVDGLRRRPPSVHVARVSTATNYDDALIHLIDRDGLERYAAVFLKDGIQVFDLNTGAPQTVNAPSGFAYLNSTAPRLALRATTAADFTFLVNRGTTVKMTNKKSPAELPQAIIFFRAANFSEKFTVNVNGAQFVMTLPKADTDDDNRYALNTAYLAEQLSRLMRQGNVSSPPPGAQGIVAAASSVLGSADWTVVEHGSVVHIFRKDGADFTVAASDGEGDNHMKVIKGAVQKLSDLPKSAVEGFMVKVIGDPETEGTDYWVRFSEQTSVDVVAPPTGIGGGGVGSGPSNSGGGGFNGGDGAPIWRNPFFNDDRKKSNWSTDTWG